jgi:transcriptional repressor NrdR
MSDAAVRRRRECLSCTNRFTTYEKAFFNLMVVKKDGREQPFAIQKISRSIEQACPKIEASVVQTMTSKIERKLLPKKSNPIKTKAIGKLVLQELRKHNKIAYLRFASIHKAIEDPKTFEKELQTIA